jgi:tRNA1(Val) A37 N6-methylase TrmN6
MVGWALAGGAKSVLEPSCGEGEFLVAAAEHLAGRGGGAVVGVDIHDISVAAARERVVEWGYSRLVEIVCADFLAWSLDKKFDAVVGNPPYVRFQDLGEEGRSRAQAACRAGGVEISGLASLWAAFVVRSGEMLNKGGRLALVLPGELLSAGYGGAIREYLLSRFGEINLVLIEGREFIGAATESVLVLASGAGEGPSSGILVSRVGGAGDLGGVDVSKGEFIDVGGGSRWSGALVSNSSVVGEAGNALGALELGEWGRVSLGTVTGANSFFVLTPERALELGVILSCVDVVTAKALRGQGPVLSKAGLAKAGSMTATKLFYPAVRASGRVGAYIKWGEDRGVDAGYKCRIRDPWWRVPVVAPAGVLVTYMNGAGVRLVANSSGATHLNSLHGLYLKRGTAGLARALAVAGGGGLSLASAELVGRSYGGGVLKVEPGEAAKILVPSAALVLRKKSELLALEGW